MKKLIKITLFIILTLSIISCSKDDNDEINTLSGTSWEYASDDTIRTITFTSEKYYHYLAVGRYGGDDITGSYTFSNNNGVLTDQYGTVEFYINGNLLTIDYNKGTGQYEYSSGTDNFSKKN